GQRGEDAHRGRVRRALPPRRRLGVVRLGRRAGAAARCRVECVAPPESETMEAIELLRSRYSASRLGAPAPSAEAVEAMLEAAARAPDHGRLQPWRLIFIEGEARRSFGEVLAASLARRNPLSGEQALVREREKALRAPLIVVVTTRYDRSGRVPIVEQIVSAGCAAH